MRWWRSDRAATGTATRSAFALRYRRGPVEGLVGVDDIFGSKWRSSEFYHESLQDEAEGVEDFHFTPGDPRNVRLGVTCFFR